MCLTITIWHFLFGGEFSSRNGSSYVLLTFDTHADTRPPFTSAIYSKYDYYDTTTSKKYKSDVLSKYNCDIDNFVFQDAFELALVDIKNDEHIQTACYFGYISDYHVFCALDEYERLSYQRDDQILGFGAFYHSKDHLLFMSDSEIESLIAHPFILDFDLDYFTSKEIFSDLLFQKMKPLIRHAFRLEDFPFVFHTVDHCRELLAKAGIQICHEVASDGASELLQDLVNVLDEASYQQYLRYHFYICEKPEFLGMSNHLLYVGESK